MAGNGYMAESFENVLITLNICEIRLDIFAPCVYSSRNAEKAEVAEQADAPDSKSGPVNSG